MVLPFCRTSTARPGASVEVTPEKSASIFFCLERSADCDCDWLGAPKTRRTRARQKKIRVNEPPLSKPKDNTAPLTTLCGRLPFVLGLGAYKVRYTARPPRTSGCSLLLSY